MRIIGYLDIPSYKVTVFQQGMRFTVKFEDGFYEQSFKFRQSEEISGLAAIQQLIDEPFIQQVEEGFELMRQSMTALMHRHFKAEEEDDFEEII